MPDTPPLPDARLDPILDAWQQAFDHGAEIPPAELCRECPELLPAVERQVAVLRRMAALNRGTGEAPADPAPGDAGTLSHPGPADANTASHDGRRTSPAGQEADAPRGSRSEGNWAAGAWASCTGPETPG